MKRTLLIAVIALSAICAPAQEALWGGAGAVISPQVNPDNSVTFRYVSPTAKTVKVTGDFLPKVRVATPHGEFDMPGTADLVRGADGVWSYTTEPLRPELYLYNMVVDSVTTLDPLNLYINRDITSMTNRLLVPGEASMAYDENMDIPHGTVRKMWYNSPGMGFDRRLSVYTPAGYEASGSSYPVLYLLHGMGGDENAWLENGRIAQIMDWMIAKGLAEPMIVVIPNGNPEMQISPADGSLLKPQPQMSEYQVVNGAYEAAFPEIVEFIETNFRTISDKAHRALAGLSMGGFHTLTISKEYPEMFDYIGLFSAATHRAMANFMKPDLPEVYSDYEGKLARQFAEAPALYWIGIGKDDFLYNSNVDFRKILDAAGYPYEYYESDGGHTWRNWRDYIKIFAPKLFRQQH